MESRPTVHLIPEIRLEVLIFCLDPHKLWEEFDNNPANRPDQVTFEIQRNHTTDAAAWKNGYIRITKPAKDTANSWERADVDKLSANSGES